LKAKPLRFLSLNYSKNMIGIGVGEIIKNQREPPLKRAAFRAGSQKHYVFL